MPRIYKGTTAKLALMYYPCVINPSDVSELTIAIYSEGTNEAIEYSLANMTLKDNIAFINLAKYQLDVLDNGVIKYVARGVYKGNDFVQDRYSNYYIQTPKDYVIEDVAIQDIKRVDISELITNVLPDSGYDGMGEVVVDANPLINNVADNAVALDVDKNGTYVAELADNYKGYIKEINVSVPSVNVEQLTQEEYDNITPAKDILYLISDAIPEYNLKTINGETLVGEGDIKIDVDLTGYATEQWVDDKGYLKEIPEEYVTDIELANKNYVDTSYLNTELEGYAKQSYVDDAIANVGNGNIVELTQEEYDNIIPDEDTLYVITDAPEIEIPDTSEFVTNTELADKNYVDIYYLDNKNYATNDSVNDTYNFLVEQLNEIFPQYAEKQWVEDKGYLKEIPEEYITETELADKNYVDTSYLNGELEGYAKLSYVDDALANIGGGSDIPYVVIKYVNPTLSVLSGDLDAVVNAIKNKEPYLAYFYNTYSAYGGNKWIYQFTLCYADNTSFSLSYHTEFGSVHKDISINGKFDSATQKYTLTTIGAANHNYLTSIPEEYITETELNDALANVGGGNGNIVELTQEEYDNITPDEETLYLISDVAPKENLKTINGESIIGTGDIVIESNVDLTGYATEQWVEDKEYAKLSYVDEQLGNINTILENILN